MKHLYCLLTLAIGALSVTSCSKESGQVTSSGSMLLGCDSLRLGNEAHTEITLELTSDHTWVLDSVLPAAGSETVDWLTVYDREGTGKSSVKLSCKQNESTADRLALIRFKVKGAYAEYRTCTVVQSGTPSVTTNPVSRASAESITLSGSCAYTGTAITRTGFEVWQNDKEETKEVLFAGKNSQAILCINKLNVKEATNIKLDFGYCSYASKSLKELTVEYSNDGGKTWTEVDWELIIPFVSGKYIQAQTSGKITGSDNLSLRLTLNVPSNGADVRLDDLRILGDYL